MELLPSSEEANPSGWLFQDTLCATRGKDPATNWDPMARLRVIFPSEKALRGPMLSWVFSTKRGKKNTVHSTFCLSKKQCFIFLIDPNKEDVVWLDSHHFFKWWLLGWRSLAVFFPFRLAGSLKRVKVRPPSEFVAKGAHTTQKGPSGGLHKMNHCSLKNLGYLKKVGQILLHASVFGPGLLQHHPIKDLNLKK